MHGSRGGEAGIDNPGRHADAANINGGLWDHAFASFGAAKDRIADAFNSLKLPELQLSNHWHLQKHLDGGLDQISTQAEVNVPANDFLVQNPALAKKLGGDAAKITDKDIDGAAAKDGFNVRHATTGEVDAGWKFESINKDGSIRLAKDYTMDVKAADKHDSKLVETLPGVPPEHTRALEKKLAEVPPGVLQALTNQGYKIIACPTNTDAIPELKGKTPRGWPEDTTFDNSDGTHDNVRRVILAPYRVKQGNDFVPVDREDVVVHQIGHALDHALGKLSNSPEFQKAFKADMQKLAEKGFMTDREKMIYDYFNQKDGPDKNERPGSEEAFASLFGMVLTGPENPEDRVPFEKNFPETIKVVRDQIAKLSTR